MIEGELQARSFVAERTGERGMARLDILDRELREENVRQNLVSSASLDSLWRRHFTDSAQLLDYVPRETVGPWLDLGSGAGLPGLVIAAMRPEISVVLVESRRKRIDWLNRMIDVLDLAQCRVEGRRLELVESFPAKIISARAFAPLPRLVDLSARFSTSGTHWVLPKGRSAAQEIAEMPRRFRKMFHVEQSQTDPEAGIIIGKGRLEAKT